MQTIGRFAGGGVYYPKRRYEHEPFVEEKRV
jgi:hypothetical protein